MKIGILSDIHGNASALAQVLHVARYKKIDRLIVLGDLIGYYYDARGVLRLLRDWSFDAIGGNHERLLAETTKSAERAADYRRQYGSSLDVAQSTLSSQDIEWLVNLPDRAQIVIDGLRLELCHGSPNHPEAYVYPDASHDILASCRISGCDFVLMGHTHYPFIAAGPVPNLINPGSVGQARDRGGFACWCHIDTATWSVVFEQTPYDTTALVAEARSRDPHIPYLTNVLARGRLLDQNSERCP